MDYEPHGACKILFGVKDPEVIISGPAGTGKSRSCLEKAHWLLEKYERMRGIMIRKTRRSMTQSCVVTYEQEVLPRPDYVPFHGGDQEYRYPNGSRFAIAGIDDPLKIYSSQWDFAYVNQAEELLEGEWESIKSRLRNYKMPYQQLLGDVNPADPRHWIRTRSSMGTLKLLESRHEDNPVYWNKTTKEWTEKGRLYVLGTLDSLTGVRKKRLRFGQWAAAEGAVYEESWDRAHHVIDRFTNAALDKDQVPADWPRYWVVDFGYKNPFVWQAWAEDPDGRLYRYKEIYRTGVIVEDHAKRILEVTKDDPKPRAIICDHDAEDRATLARHIGFPTKPAYKAVSQGIQAVEARLRPDKQNRARLFYLRDSVVDIDPALLAAKQPLCSEDEFEVYVWDTSLNRRLKEEPVKQYDHGADCVRYLVAYIDQIHKVIPQMFSIISMTKSGDAAGSETSLTGTSKWHMDTNAPGKWGN